MAETLDSCIAFLLLSKFNNAQNDMLHRISLLKQAQKASPDFMTVVTLMKTMEIIPPAFPMKEGVVARLRQCCEDADRVALSMPTTRIIPSESSRTGSDMIIDRSADIRDNNSIGDSTAHAKANCLVSLNDRIIEHNIRVLSHYYTSIRTVRAAEMLGLSVDELEAHLAEIAQPAPNAAHARGKIQAVVSEDEEAGTGGTSLYVRMNRPEGIISFAAPNTAESTLSDWASDITGLFNLMETTCHLINRENMIYKV